MSSAESRAPPWLPTLTVVDFSVCVCARRAVRYRRRYLRELNFDNAYISSQFEELDKQVTTGGGASVLPITRREAKTYITPRQYTCVCVCVCNSSRCLLK